PSATWSGSAPSSPGCRAPRSTPSRAAITPSASRAARDAPTPTSGRRSSASPPTGCAGWARSQRPRPARGRAGVSAPDPRFTRAAWAGASPRQPRARAEPAGVASTPALPRASPPGRGDRGPLPAARLHPRRGAHEAGVVGTQPCDRRCLALSDEAEYLARLGVVMEAVEDVGDRARRARVIGITGKERGEFLLVGDPLGAEALERGGAHGLGECRARRDAHLAEALGQELGVSGLPLRDDA